MTVLAVIELSGGKICEGGGRGGGDVGGQGVGGRVGVCGCGRQPRQPKEVTRGIITVAGDAPATG